MRSTSVSQNLPSLKSLAQALRSIQLKGHYSDEQISAGLKWARANYATSRYCRKIRSTRDIAGAVESWISQALHEKPLSQQGPQDRVEAFSKLLEKNIEESERLGSKVDADIKADKLRKARAVEARARERARLAEEEQRRRLAEPIDWDHVS